MKIVVVIFLLVVYSTIICGFTVSFHYCGGRLASVDLLITGNKHSCGCGSKGMKKGCCKTKSVYVQYTADQKLQHTTVNFNSTAKDLIVLFTANEVFIHPYDLKPTVGYSQIPPPLLAESNLAYLRNRTLKI